MLFKDISYLELWWPLCSAEWNHLCNFGRRPHEEQFCEIVSGTICAILVEGNMRNNSVKMLFNLDQ